MHQAPQPVVAPQQSVTVVPATQTVTVITSPPLQTSHLCENYAVKQAYVLGVMQVYLPFIVSFKRTNLKHTDAGYHLRHLFLGGNWRIVHHSSDCCLIHWCTRC